MNAQTQTQTQTQTYKHTCNTCAHTRELHCLFELIKTVSAMLLNNLGENDRELHKGHHVEQNGGPAEGARHAHSCGLHCLQRATHVL